MKTNFRYLVWTAMLCFLTCPNLAAQDDNVQFVIQLNDDRIMNLRDGHAMSQIVPERLVGKIKGVEIRYENLDASASTTQSPAAPANVIKGVVNVRLNPQDIKLLRNRSIRLNVDDVRFTSCEISLDNNADSLFAAAEQELSNIYVIVDDKQMLSGHLVATGELTVSTKYNEMTIQLEDVLAIKSQDGANPKMHGIVMAMQNGDIISGDVPRNLGFKFQIKTIWGTGIIDITKVDQLTRSPHLRLEKTKHELGSGWKFGQVARRGIPSPKLGLNTFQSTGFPKPKSNIPPLRPKK